MNPQRLLVLSEPQGYIFINIVDMKFRGNTVMEKYHSNFFKQLVSIMFLMVVSESTFFPVGSAFSP